MTDEQKPADTLQTPIKEPATEVEFGDFVNRTLYTHLTDAIAKITAHSAEKDVKLTSGDVAFYIGSAACARLYSSMSESELAKVQKPTALTMHHLPNVLTGFIAQLDEIRKAGLE